MDVISQGARSVWRNDSKGAGLFIVGGFQSNFPWCNGVMIQKERVCSLSAVFKAAFPGVIYKSESTKRHLLRMPLACIRMGEPSAGNSELFVMESVVGADCEKIHHLWNANLKSRVYSINRFDQERDQAIVKSCPE